MQFASPWNSAFTCFTQFHRTPIDNNAMTNFIIKRFVNLDDMTSWSFLIIAALAGLLRQRHFQTCYDHCQNTSYFDILSKAAIQTKFPNALLEILQACFFISLLSVPISTDSMAVARCLIRLDLIDIYHRLI